MWEAVAVAVSVMGLAFLAFKVVKSFTAPKAPAAQWPGGGTGSGSTSQPGDEDVTI